MLSFARRRFTFANVAMTVVLVFAMSGGAFAAGKFLITTTKQISPKVLKSLQGKAGRAGAAGAQGPAGPAGPQGPAGPKGETGAQGAPGTPGTNGKNGTNGTNGKEGSPWTAGGTLPSGKTEQGTWATVFVPGPFSIPSGAVSTSFNIPLSVALSTTGCDGGTGTPPATCQIHFILANGKELIENNMGEAEEVTATSACPGSGQAAAGNLCVYTESEATSISARVITSTTPGGVVLTLLNLPKVTNGLDSGTWAVTAV